MVYIYPYKYGSRSAKKIATAIGATRIRDSTYRRLGLTQTPIINWGSTTLPMLGNTILNKPDKVKVSVNKTTALKAMHEAGIRVPEFTEDSSVATSWLRDNAVYARKLTRASEGRGIEIVHRGKTQVPYAPLYTKAIESSAEYRVHVFNGSVIDYTKKIPNIRVNISDRGTSIEVRSHQNGWTFARNIEPRESVKKIAIGAVKALGLDFGAVDILINKDDKPVVLEINTAMGMEGKTLESYKKAFNNYFYERQLPINS